MNRGTTHLAGLLLVSALLVAACGNPAQQEAYARVRQLDQHAPPEQYERVIIEYKKVIAMSPNSTVAKQAAAHLKTAEARLAAHHKAEEIKETVFHQTGVD